LDPILEDFLSDPAARSFGTARCRPDQGAFGKLRAGRSCDQFSELLLNLGFRFTRPKMRAVCKTLDRIDALTAQEGTPALAVLVVREGDGLPGQGWWTGRTDYQGQWTGPDAEAHIAKLQAAVFAYWKGLGR
jgi:hypothetical protein